MEFRSGYFFKSQKKMDHVKENDNPEGGSAMDVEPATRTQDVLDNEHDNSEEKLKRQARPHDNCTLTWVALKEEGLSLFEDCPKCKRLGVSVEVSDHPQTAQSAPSSGKPPTDTHTPLLVYSSTFLSHHHLH